MILIAIGANLPSPDGTAPRETCLRALDAISALPGLKIAALSKWYQSVPIPASDQPLYNNCVARLAGWADPAALLRDVLAIETAHGRTRSVPNAARVLDIDIIAMAAIVRSSPDPVLPHPRMHERAFVLQPLLDVAPEWTHPVLGLSARALLARLPLQSIHVMPP